LEILIIRNRDVHYLYDVALVDFDGETSKYLQQFLDFETAAEVRREYSVLYKLSVDIEEVSE